MTRKWTIPFLGLLMALILVTPALAAAEYGVIYDETEQLGYVFDTVLLLGDGEWNRLENMAETVSTRYNCGVYIVTVDDYEEYGTGDVVDVTTQIYHDNDNGFGVSPGRDGIMLLLSMDNRDWSMFVYGENAKYAFNSYGQEQLEEVFLDNFAGNDWYGGFSDYIETCGEYLAKAEAGMPVSANPLWGIGLSTGLSCLVALAVCMVMKRKMKTARQKIEADAYISNGGLMLTASHDHYTHTTETRRKIESSSGSSSGGGGSGRSGKF